MCCLTLVTILAIEVWQQGNEEATRTDVGLFIIMMIDITRYSNQSGISIGLSIAKSHSASGIAGAAYDVLLGTLFDILQNRPQLPWEATEKQRAL